MNYPVIKKQELIRGKLVEMLDEGKTFGQKQICVYIEEGDGTRFQFGESKHTLEEAEEVFKNALSNVSLK